MNRKTDVEMKDEQNIRHLDIRKLIGIGLLVIALCTIIAGVTEYVTYERKIKGKDKAEATADKVENAANSAGSPTQKIVQIKFRVNRMIYDGIKITVDKKDLRGGDTFNIYYKRENPFDASEIVAEKEGLSYEIYILCGIILCVIAVFMIKKGNLSMRIEESRQVVSAVDDFDEFMKETEMLPVKKTDKKEEPQESNETLDK